MADETVPPQNPPAKEWKRRGGRGGAPGSWGGTYFLAFIGAAVYFIQHSDSFWMGVLGFLKALVWPAFLMYKLLEILKM